MSRGKVISKLTSMDRKDKAKQFPILSLYKDKLKRSGKAWVGRCSLHNDDNPSLAFYPETNSFFCFAEGKGGDVIDFFMQLKNVDFPTAIKELSK